MALVLHATSTNKNSFKALIAAEYTGVKVELAKDFEMGVSNKTSEFLKMNPIGKVPVLETPDGAIFESNAIARYGCNGVCIMSTTWKDEQHPSFINFISCFLNENSCRLNFVSIDPDFIFNCGGVSAAFIFVTNWDSNDNASIFGRVQKLRGQFANLYLVVTLPTKDQNDSFVRSYFKYGMELGRPAFMPVKDLEMGFEKIVKVALARGACKKQDVTAKLRAEREISVQSLNLYIKVVTSIPGIDNHDAHALNQAIGSIEAIAKASKEYIMDNTDLSAEKAELIARFFGDPKYYLGPKIK